MSGGGLVRPVGIVLIAFLGAMLLARLLVDPNPQAGDDVRAPDWSLAVASAGEFTSAAATLGPRYPFGGAPPPPEGEGGTLAGMALEGDGPGKVVGVTRFTSVVRADGVPKVSTLPADNSQVIGTVMGVGDTTPDGWTIRSIRGVTIRLEKDGATETFSLFEGDEN